jgi:hypothetical protein
MIEMASLLTLRAFVSRPEARLESDVRNRSSLLGKLGVLFGKAFPPKKVIATIYPVAEDSRVIYLWYAANWWRVLSTRLPGYLASKGKAHTVNEARHIMQLEQWLLEPSGVMGPARATKN